MDIQNVFDEAAKTPLSRLDSDTLYLESIIDSARAAGVRIAEINNRRYLGNKHGLTKFIKETVQKNCAGTDVVVDIFAGTGAVANAFSEHTIYTNDILYSNYLSHIAWFSPEKYRPRVIEMFIKYFNRVETSENNYMRKNFADTYFSADICSKIGYIREIIEKANNENCISQREFAILVTSLLYGMDRIANTVGHYDAYRKKSERNPILDIPLILPSNNNHPNNKNYNQDANTLIDTIECDLLYLDPPYNSRQYSDAYHLLENVAQWKKPEVFGVARKMNRKSLKSDYNTVRAPEALRTLVSKAKTKYIVFSYNNMADKGNGRSNAKISDEEILEILSEKGTVEVFETAHKAFSTGKSKIEDNSERLFICKVKQNAPVQQERVLSPINYIGGKGKLLPQILPLFPKTTHFVDLFCGGCNVGSNIEADFVTFNDSDSRLVKLINYLAENDADELITAVDRKIKEYGLSSTFSSSYANYNAKSTTGLGSYNRDSYIRLRTDYNNKPDDDSEKSLYLYLLVIFGFNNQIRFNKNGHHNLPVGKRDFNSKMRKKLVLFRERFQNLNYRFMSTDFRNVDISLFPQDTVFYCDPPYLITNATYNERGSWSEKDEKDLLVFLDNVDQSGRKFALSNVMEAKGKSNEILRKWLEGRKYKRHNLNMSYSNSNYHRTREKSSTIEILITNY